MFSYNYVQLLNFTYLYVSCLHSSYLILQVFYKIATSQKALLYLQRKNQYNSYKAVLMAESTCRGFLKTI